MVAKHYVILFNFLGTKGAINASIEGALAARGADWLRFSPTGYLVYSALGPEALYAAIKPLLHPNDLVLVSETNLANRQGWASQLAIDWIKKYAP